MSQRRRAFTLSDGTVIYDIIGADSGDEDNNDDDDSDDDGDDNDNDDTNGDDDDDDDEDDKDKKSTKKLTRTELEAALTEAEAKADREHRRMVRADKAKSNAVKELQALKSGGAKELSDAKERITELEGQLAAAKGTDTTSLIREEFRDDSTFQWQNPKVAFGLLNLDDVDVEDGKVDAASLKDAIAELAKEHPYLVKKAEKSKDDDADDDDKDSENEDDKPSKSGESRNGRRRNNSSTNRQVLEKKFPQLNGRF